MKNFWSHFRTALWIASTLTTQAMGQWVEITHKLPEAFPRPPDSRAAHYKDSKLFTLGSDLYLSTPSRVYISKNGSDSFTIESITEPDLTASPNQSQKVIIKAGDYLWAESRTVDNSTLGDTATRRLLKKHINSDSWMVCDDFTFVDDISFPGTNSPRPIVTDVAYDDATKSYYLMVFNATYSPLEAFNRIDITDSTDPNSILLTGPPREDPWWLQEPTEAPSIEIWKSEDTNTWTKIESLSLADFRGISLKAYAGTLWIFEAGEFPGSYHGPIEHLWEFRPDGTKTRMEIKHYFLEPNANAQHHGQLVFFQNHTERSRGTINTGTSIAARKEVELPIDVTEFITHENYIFAVGSVSPIYEALPTNAGIFYSATNGRTWEELDSAGIPNELFIEPLYGYHSTTPLSGYTSAIDIAINDNSVFVFTDDLRVFKRPLAELDLSTENRILSHPKHQITHIGEPAELSVDAVGEGPLRYQWFKDGQLLMQANEEVLTFASITDSDIGNYTVKVTDENGSTTSHAARIGIKETFQEFAFTRYPEGQRNLSDDGNNNGIQNVIEFLFPSEENQTTKTPAITPQAGAALGWPLKKEDFYMTFELKRRVTASGITLTPMFAPSINALKTSPQEAIPVGAPNLEGEIETQMYRAPFTMEESSSGFMHIVIE